MNIINIKLLSKGHIAMNIKLLKNGYVAIVKVKFKGRTEEYASSIVTYLQVTTPLSQNPMQKIKQIKQIPNAILST